VSGSNPNIKTREPAGHSNEQAGTMSPTERRSLSKVIPEEAGPASIMNEVGFLGLPWSIGRVVAGCFCLPIMVAGSRERAARARALACLAGARSISGPERMRRRKLPRHAFQRTVHRLFEHRRCSCRRHAHLIRLVGRQTRW
jgi:hypothetical protein